MLVGENRFPVSRRRLLVAGLLGPLVVACGRKQRWAQVPPGAPVLAFGDSVTYGTGAAAGEDWPTLLASRTGWRIVNAGIPGDTAEAATARIGPLLAAHRPVLVIIELGGNDFLKRRPATAVKASLQAIVREVRAAGAQPLLVAVPELSLLGVVARRPSDAPLYRELADAESLPLVEGVFADVLARPELCADAIHPNADGYRVMADGLHRALVGAGIAAP